MAFRDDYFTILSGVLTNSTKSGTPFDQAKTFINEQVVKYNLSGEQAAQLTASTMANMAIGITNSAIQVALSVKIAEDRTPSEIALNDAQTSLAVKQGAMTDKQASLVDAQIATEVLRQQNITADTEYKNSQKTSLEDTIVDNRLVKSLDSLSNLTLGISSGGLVPPVKLLTNYFELVNALTGKSLSTTGGDYPIEGGG